MITQHVETLIIGAGQAGLATGYHLEDLGREFLIVDGGERVGDSWRRHYDSLTLFTPAKFNSLDGLPFPGDPWSFPTKDEMADYIELYAVTFDLPVRLRTRVQHLAADDGGGFVATLDGQRIKCENVVIATGTFGHTPQVPAFARLLDPRIRQLHSSEYRAPVQVADRPVLVVGASHSGLDIAFELGASRPTTLVGPARGAIPFRVGEPGVAPRVPVHRVRLHPRPHPPHADGPQDDGAGAPPRRSAAPCQAPSPRRAGRRVGGGPRRRGVRQRAATAG